MGMRSAPSLNINDSTPRALDDLQTKLLNDFQRDFPLSPTPYADIAARLGVTEAEVLTALQELEQSQIISRVGPVFNPHRIGTSTLVAMAIPQERLQSVADYISSLPEVNHNYEREYKLNLWFVVTAATIEHLQAVLLEIEKNTGIAVLSLPMLKSYHIDLGFDLNRN